MRAIDVYGWQGLSTCSGSRGRREIEVAVTVGERVADGVTGAELVCDVGRAEALASEWDALAVGCGAPTSCPAWMLAWWRHLAPSSAVLRLIAVRRDGELIGVLPFYVDLASRSTERVYRLLADDFSPRVMPVGRPDCIWEAAQAAAGLLGRPELRPDRIELGPTPAGAPWPVALRERWPGAIRPFAYRAELLMAPTIWLKDRSFDDWLSERGARFRANLRRYRRLFEEAGGTYRLVTPATVAADIDSFAELHARRWDGRDSRLVAAGDRLAPFLEYVAASLLAEHRLRLLMLEVDGKPICADLWLAAGREVTGINAGWDERYKRLSPPQLALRARCRTRALAGSIASISAGGRWATNASTQAARLRSAGRCCSRPARSSPAPCPERFPRSPADAWRPPSSVRCQKHTSHGYERPAPALQTGRVSRR
ncbi:MAG: GNAT family N-acetyltransferase [Solirubrobacteraceae bacterium]